MTTAASNNRSVSAAPPPAALRDQADPGEPILWWSQPDPRVLLRARLAGEMATMLTPCIGIVIGLRFLVLTHLEITDYNPDFESGWMFFLVYAAGGLLLAFFGWFGLLAPRHIIREARTTFYAITPRRIIFMRLRRRRVIITSYQPRHPLTLQRTDSTPGRGTIVLPAPIVRGKGNTSSLASGRRTLDAIPNPREVDRLIRNTFEPPAGARRFPRT